MWYRIVVYIEYGSCVYRLCIVLFQASAGSGSGADKLGIKNVGGVFVVLFGGIFVAAFVAFIELVYYVWSKEDRVCFICIQYLLILYLF